MDDFIDAAIKALVRAWYVASVVAGQTPRAPTNRAPDIRNPWNNLPLPERIAIERAVEAGIWPEDVPLTEKPEDWGDD